MPNFNEPSGSLHISKITLPGSNNPYYLKDAAAREAIAALEGGSYFLGVTTTALTDGSTTNPITIDDSQVTATNGNMVVYGSKEFVWSGTTAAAGGHWVEFGDLSTLGQLAYKDNVTLSKGSGDNVLGKDTTFTASSSNVTFANGAGSDFVTGYNNDAVAPTFSEGAFTPASLGEGFYSAGSTPSFSEGAFTPAQIQAGFYISGSAASFSEGAFTPAAIQSGFVKTSGSAASYSHSGFSGGSLGNPTTSSFAVEGVNVAMGSGDDAETLVITAATTSAAVTAQGTFTPAVYGEDSFTPNTPTVIDVTKFSGGSKSADTFVTNTPTTIDTSKFSGGSKSADTFNAGSMTSLDLTKFNGGSKAADTFSAGSAATLAKAKAITADVTGSAAAQVIAVGTNDVVKVAEYDDLSVSVS